MQGGGGLKQFKNEGIKTFNLIEKGGIAASLAGNYAGSGFGDFRRLLDRRLLYEEIYLTSVSFSLNLF